MAGSSSEDRFSVRSNSSSTDDTGPHRTNFSMTYNDDNIDNTSEKPIDYSQRYQETNSVYGGGVGGSMSASSAGGAMNRGAEQQSGL